MTRPLGKRQVETLLRLQVGQIEWPFSAWHEPSRMVQALVRLGLAWAEFTETKTWDGIHGVWRTEDGRTYTAGLTPEGEARAALENQRREGVTE